MTEVAKGPSNLSQLAIRGNYRDFAAQDTDKVYSRNMAHRQIPASDFAQKAFGASTSLESIKEAPLIFSGATQQLATTSYDIEFQGLKPMSRALKF